MNENRALVYCAGGGIGDSLIASLVARALRQRYSVVDALTLPGHRSTLEHVRDIDEVLVDEGENESELSAKLTTRRYDACVVTWATARTAKVPYLAKIPVRVGQARRLYSWQFTNRVNIRSESGDTTSHWSDIQLDYARALNCDLPIEQRIPNFSISHEDEAEAYSVTGDFILLHTTNAIAAERGIWPVQGWIELASVLHEEYGVPVLLTGTNADRPVIDAIIQGAPDAVSLAGALGIGGFAALAKRAKVVVGMGTGTLHVAGVVGAATVALFPMQSDFPERWCPLGERVRVVRASYPCYPGDTKETCADYACIANLPVKAILATVRELTG